jgi:uncharacterized protein (DUF885 family)
MTQTNRTVDSIGPALRIIDDAWQELRKTPFVQSQLDAPLDRLTDLSLGEFQRRSRVGQSLLSRAAAVDVEGLPHDLALTLRIVRFRAQIWAQEASWYWTVIDPSGVGFFGMFLPSAYCGGHLMSLVHSRLGEFKFFDAGDCDRYLGLTADYARLIDQFAARTIGQRERGMLIPRAQVEPARGLLAGLKATAQRSLSVAAERLQFVKSSDFNAELDRRIRDTIDPAFDRAIAVLSQSYWNEAPINVGLDQYPLGADIYSALVKLHTTLDLTPDQIHARGIERMKQIEADMLAIRTELGFDGDGAAFVAQLNTDTRWRANTVDGVAAVFQRYIDRLAPHVDKYFAVTPKASYGVAPLPDALQASMTFGYYDAPRSDRNKGLYLFNSGNLTKQALFNIGALTYHELVPGHHLHFSTQKENAQLHPIRTHSFVNAYNEGWAEYAASFAGEIGMYEQPEERYGRLVMDAFLTCRLVVDTGMNVLGWSLERAREYMRAHSGMTETEVLSETLRYSCDIPAQSLAYKLGDLQIIRLRDRMKGALGAAFDLKVFHATVLGPGALPMIDLEWHVDWEIERLRANA